MLRIFRAQMVKGIDELIDENFINENYTQVWIVRTSLSLLFFLFAGQICKVSIKMWPVYRCQYLVVCNFFFFLHSVQDLESHILLKNVETGCEMEDVNLEGIVNFFTDHFLNQNQELRVSEALWELMLTGMIFVVTLK